MANWFAGEPKEQLAGKTAVVMGGGSGIGKATAQALCAAGANVMVCGVPEQICLDTAEELKAEGGKAIGMFCDGTKQSDIDAMLTKTVEEFGGIDMVVSTAGISLPRTNALDVTEEMWEKIFAVNVKANWFIATSAAKYMKDKGGKIVLVSSGRGDRAMENIAPYCTTKSAVMGMVRALAVDLAQYNIKVNGIAPGYVRAALHCPTSPTWALSTRWQKQLCSSCIQSTSTPLVRPLLSTVVGLSSNSSTSCSRVSATAHC